MAAVAAISKDRGLIDFEFRQGSFKSEDFLSFIKRLRENTEAPRFAILLDNCSIHKGKILK